ncbi:hypothetical protein X733_04525 [Mesorhizobium sp. L2C067A000]|nr:hypothetical protein X733_04525 [Mesorhizobium sp. L2C067A000]
MARSSITPASVRPQISLCDMSPNLRPNGVSHSSTLNCHNVSVKWMVSMVLSYQASAPRGCRVSSTLASG